MSIADDTESFSSLRCDPSKILVPRTVLDYPFINMYGLNSITVFLCFVSGRKLSHAGFHALTTRFKS